MYREACHQQPACGRVSTLTSTLERMMTQAMPINLVRWHYLWYVALALVVMITAIISHHLWFLNFLHVFSGLLWTGIDLFMGFVLGPILRVVELQSRPLVKGRHNQTDPLPSSGVRLDTRRPLRET